jgi:integrase
VANDTTEDGYGCGTDGCGFVAKTPAGLANHRRAHARRDRRTAGKGSVYQMANGQWCAQIEAGFTPAGRRKYLRRWRPNRKQAEDALGELLRQQQRNLEPGTSGQMLTAYLDAWVDGLEGVLAPKTVAAYRADIAHVKSVIGTVRLDKLTPTHVRQLLTALPKRGLAPKSALNVRTTLNTAVQQAVKDRILDWNPVAVVDRPRVERVDVVPLTAYQAKQVLAALDGHRLAALYSVAVAVGLRLSEALGLTWDRIDLDIGVVQVRKQVQRLHYCYECRRHHGRKTGCPWCGATPEARDRHYVLVDLKSKRSRRDIPLPGFATRALRDHRRLQVAERLESGPRWTDGCCDRCSNTDWDLVFTTHSDRTAGRPIHPTQALKFFQDTCETAVGMRPRFHDLRHTAATLLLAQGVPLAEIQDILGHSSITVTKDLYSHLDVEHLRGAAGKMDELLG